MPISHEGWTVTALNQAGVYGNEGGVAFIADENAKTFYHSDYNAKYEGRDAKKGQDGLQAFMVELPNAVSNIKRITYTGRSDNNTSGWARGVRIYVFETLPEGWPADGLSSLSYDAKQTLLASTNAALGTAAFDNTAEESLWANDRTKKTADFAEAKNGKYVLFVMEKGHDNWLTCADFQIYSLREPAVVSNLQNVNPIRCYTVTTSSRGGWATNDAGTEFTSTGGATPDATNNKHQFAFVTLGDGEYFLWSVSANKFVLSSKSLNGTSFEPVKFHDASSQGEGCVMVQFDRNSNGYINLGGSKQMVVNSWNTIDAGNAVKIQEADVFDPTAALEIIRNNYLKNYINNNVKYAVSNPRGAWVSDDTRLNGTSAKGVAVDKTNEDQQFAFLKSSKGNTYLYSVADKKFVSKEGSYTKFTDAPIQSVYLQNGKKANGCPWVVTFNDNSQIGISNGYNPNVITFYNDLSDEGNCVKIEFAGEFNSTEIVEHINATEELIDVVSQINEKKQHTGTKVGYYTVTDEDNNAITALNEVVAAIAEKTSAEIKKQLQIAIALNDKILNKPVLGKFYYIVNNKTLGKWAETEHAVYADNANLKWKAKAEDNTFLWQAMPVNGGITLKNYSTGKYITGNASQSGGWSLTDNAEAIEFATCGYGTDFALMNLTLKNWNMHAGNHGGGNNPDGGIVSWNGGAGSASAWTIVEAEIPIEDLRALVTTAITEIQPLAKYGDGYGYYSCDNELKAEVEAALVGFDTATAEAEALYNVLNKILVFKPTVSSVLNVPAANSYVRIAYDFGGETGKLYVQGEASGVPYKANAPKMTAATDAASIFYFYDSKLLSYTAGLYLKEDGGTRGLQAMNAAAGETSFEAGSVVGTLAVKVPAYMHANTSGDVRFIDHCGGAGCAAHNMIVEAVTELPVTVTAAGYASFYAPVALEIPEEGVEVFYATQVNGDYVSLVQIEDVIPANTGVIIKALDEINAGETKTYNFAITDEEVAAIEGNIFMGTVNKQVVAKGASSCYVLGIVDGNVGMYNAVNGGDANTFINAGHKAYMCLAGATNSAGYRFDFDGTTGITEVETENADNAVIYDLIGRRVQDMNRAGIYIVNGKKVLVK